MQNNYKIFRSLLKNEFKHNFFSVILSVLAQFIILVIMMFRFTESVNRYELNDVISINNFANVYTIMLIVIASVGALIMSITEFSFLFDSRRVDYIFSLPVKRNLIYLSKYVYSILVYIIPSIIVSVLNSIIVVINGNSPLIIRDAYVLGFIKGIIAFLIIFTVSTFAFMLATNYAMAIELFLFVNFLPIAVYNLILLLMNADFLDSNIVTKLINAVTPVNELVNLHKIGLEGSSSFKAMIIAVVLCVIINIINYRLFIKRDVENKIGGLAFYKTRKPIIYISVILLSLVLGYAFGRDGKDVSILWTIVGIVIGGIVGYCVESFIVYLTTKKLKQEKQIPIISIIIVIIISLLSMADIFGLSKIIPKEKDIKSIYVGYDKYSSENEIKNLSNEQYRIIQDIAKNSKSILTRNKNDKQINLIIYCDSKGSVSKQFFVSPNNLTEIDKLIKK